jgi:hypothetical protein
MSGKLAGSQHPTDRVRHQLDQTTSEESMKVDQARNPLCAALVLSSLLLGGCAGNADNEGPPIAFPESTVAPVQTKGDAGEAGSNTSSGDPSQYTR